MKPIIWKGCYDGGWKGIIVPEAFAHPAKFSRALIQRILEHGLARGYWKRGDTIGDPFGGVGLGGVEAAYRGLRWVGVELEIKFVGLAVLNFLRHQEKWDQLGLPRPVISQGDSRQFDVIVSGVVTSPPFTQGYSSGGGINKNGYDGPTGKDLVGSRTYQGVGGDRTDENIERCAVGSVDAVISSPPYAESLKGHADGIDWEKTKAKPTSGLHQAPGKSCHSIYGDDEKQIGTLRNGAGVDSVVTSPPWENNSEGKVGAHKWADAEAAATVLSQRGKGNYASPEARKAQFERDANKTYGESEGQIGKEAGETYWQAMALVYAACFRSIKLGGYIAVVVKDYVKAKQRVRLCDDTLRLLEHVGFEPVERIHAMLVEETTHETLFGETQTTKRERKSFFRRLAEKKGSPRIDYEEVLICRKPA